MDPRKLLLALSVSTAVVLSAPFMGQVRAWLRATFPGEFVAVVQGSVAAAVGMAVLIAARRIRNRRLLRFGSIAAALVLGALYNVALASGTPEIDAVERVHFVEYGVIALLFYQAWRPRGDVSIVMLPLLAGVIVGTFEEWFQWFIPVRVGELRDVGLNLVALGCGLLLSLGALPPASFSRTLRPGSLTSVGVLASAAVLAIAAFVHTVHLGYVISRPDIGSFKSRYRSEQLHALAADRAARWRDDPPLTFQRISREDQYMDEGLWHVRRRNDAWNAGDRATAWKENRILEEYFAPVLDAPSYVSPTGHRWPSEQRAAAESALTDTTAAYVSLAEPLPILTWPKGQFWLVVAAVTIAITGAARRYDRSSAAPRAVPM